MTILRQTNTNILIELKRMKRISYRIPSQLPTSRLPSWGTILRWAVLITWIGSSELPTSTIIVFLHNLCFLWPWVYNSINSKYLMRHTYRHIIIIIIVIIIAIIIVIVVVIKLFPCDLHGSMIDAITSLAPLWLDGMGHIL